MRFLRLMPGKGEVVLAEGDVELSEDEQRLIEEFRRQLDLGMWAAVPIAERGTGRREALMVRDFSEIPRRAERRARSLLKSIVNREEWEMYRDLGFIRVLGRKSAGSESGSAYAYLIYPHKPIVAYLPVSNSLLSEYCVEFPDASGSLFGPRLPDSDDVLAKWMMITADEERLLHDANM